MSEFNLSPFDYPEPDESLMEQWREDKSPQNAHSRAFLARSTKAARTYIFRITDEAEPNDSLTPEAIRTYRSRALARIKQGHMECRAAFLQAERRLFDTVTTEVLCVVPPKGGVQ